VLEAAERLLAVELVPVIAHPERSIGLRADFAIAGALVEQGCLLCPNGDSALGDNGPSPNRPSGGCWTRAWSRSSLPTATAGSGRRGSIRRTVCLSNATGRRRSKCCSTGPPYPGSGSSAEPAPSPGSTSALRCPRPAAGLQPEQTLCTPTGLGARSTPAAATSRVRSSSSASASPSCPSCLAPHPSSAASVTPPLSFLGCPYFGACAFAFGRRLPLAQQGDLPADTDRQAHPARARSHRLPGRRRRL